MVKIARFTDFASDGDYGKKFTLELDSNVKTVQADSFFFSFFFKVGCSEGDTSDSFMRSIRLACQSTNLCIFKRNANTSSSAGGLFSPSAASFSSSDSPTTNCTFAGFAGTGGIRCMRAGAISTGGGYPFKPNRWYLITTQFTRSNIPAFSPIKFNACPYGLRTISTSQAPTSTPQTGIKFSLEIAGPRIESVHLSNIWCGVEDTEIADFVDRYYLTNFVSSKGSPIEIDLDGTVGSITPVFYFKGENNDPLFDSVSQTQATHTAGNAELYEKDIFIFPPHAYGSFPDLAGGDDQLTKNWSGARMTARPEGSTSETNTDTASPIEHPPVVGFGITRGVKGVDESVFMGVRGANKEAFRVVSSSLTSPRTELGFYSISASSSSIPVASTSTTVPNSVHYVNDGVFTFLVRASGNTSTIEYFVSRNTKAPVTTFTSSVTTSVSKAIGFDTRPSILSIMYDKPVIDANPQIDWFGDATTFTENFVDFKKRKIKDGGLFGENFLGARPYSYFHLKSDLFFFMEFAFVGPIGSTSTITTQALVPPMESRRNDGYGFDFLGADYLP